MPPRDLCIFADFNQCPAAYASATSPIFSSLIGSEPPSSSLFFFVFPAAAPTHPPTHHFPSIAEERILALSPPLSARRARAAYDSPQTRGVVRILTTWAYMGVHLGLIPHGTSWFVRTPSLSSCVCYNSLFYCMSPLMPSNSCSSSTFNVGNFILFYFIILLFFWGWVWIWSFLHGREVISSWCVCWS